MKYTLRAFTLALFAAAITAQAQPTSISPGQAYPTRPIRCVVPYPPGGPTDIIGRAIAQKLTESLGQPVIIDNRGGAAGTIGSEQVALACRWLHPAVGHAGHAWHRAQHLPQTRL